MYTKSDPTADRAIGAAEREWRKIVILAYRYRTDTKTAQQIRNPRQVFNGVFSRLLTEPLEELKELAGRR